MDGSIYDEEYFLRGVQSGKSLYQDYQWMPDLTTKMVETMIAHLGIKKRHTILDFGCARGYVVKAFRNLGYLAYGYDVSTWAVENADTEIYHHLTCQYERAFSHDVVPYGWIIAKDVLEHIPNEILVAGAITDLLESASEGVFAVIPLSSVDNRPYVVGGYEMDVTHVHRLTLPTWMRMFSRPGWSVECSYRIPGIKDNYAKWKWGNGFITARRV